MIYALEEVTAEVEVAIDLWDYRDEINDEMSLGDIYDDSDVREYLVSVRGKPEDYFPEDVLHAWAEREGYVKKESR